MKDGVQPQPCATIITNTLIPTVHRSDESVPSDHPCNGVKVKLSRPHQAPPTAYQSRKEQSWTLKSAAWHRPQNQIKGLICIIFKRCVLAGVSIRDLLWPNEPSDVLLLAAPAALVQKVTIFSSCWFSSSLVAPLWHRCRLLLLLVFAWVLVVSVVIVV